MRALLQTELATVSAGTAPQHHQEELIVYQPNFFVRFVQQLAYLILNIGLNVLLDVLLDDHYDYDYYYVEYY